MQYLAQHAEKIPWHQVVLINPNSVMAALLLFGPLFDRSLNHPDYLRRPYRHGQTFLQSVHLLYHRYCRQYQTTHIRTGLAHIVSFALHRGITISHQKHVTSYHEPLIPIQVGPHLRHLEGNRLSKDSARNTGFHITSKTFPQYKAKGRTRAMFSAKQSTRQIQNTSTSTRILGNDLT